MREWTTSFRVFVDLQVIMVPMASMSVGASADGIIEISQKLAREVRTTSWLPTGDNLANR